VHVPFYLGAATVAAAIGVLATGHSLPERAEHRGAHAAGRAGAQEAVAVGEAEAVPVGTPAP
jgi:MFS transporter, ACDE family, multidrug resistance protein